MRIIAGRERDQAVDRHVVVEVVTPVGFGAGRDTVQFRLGLGGRGVRAPHQHQDQQKRGSHAPIYAPVPPGLQVKAATLALCLLLGGCITGESPTAPCPIAVIYMSVSDSVLVTDSTVVPPCRRTP